MTSGIASKGVDLDSIFSPYVGGTTQQRATGIDVNGQDLNARYANIIYGTAPPATGIKSEGADLSTLFCTGANYSLPIDGQTYSGSGHVASGLCTAGVTLQINNAQYRFQGFGTGSPGNTWTFQIPSGVSQYTYKVDSGALQPWTNIPSSGTFVLAYSISVQSSNQGTKEVSHNVTLYFGNGGSAVYSGTCTMVAVADSGA